MENIAARERVRLGFHKPSLARCATSRTAKAKNLHRARLFACCCLKGFSAPDLPTGPVP